MLHRFLVFLAEYLLLLFSITVVSFYFMNDQVSKSLWFKLFFILGALFLPAMILALLFPNAVAVKFLPHLLVGLAALLLISVVIPAGVLKERKTREEWKTLYSAAPRDFVGTEKSFLTFSADGTRLLRYSEEPGESHIEIVGELEAHGKELRPFLGRSTTLAEFRSKFVRYHNKEGKTIFEVYAMTLEPDSADRKSGGQKIH